MCGVGMNDEPVSAHDGQAARPISGHKITKQAEIAAIAT